MAEMDIYMRRRLAALGGLVLFFIVFVLLVKSCGDDDPEAPLEPTSSGTTGGAGPVALTKEEFISQADQICAPANAAVGALDPTDPDAIADEARITADEFASLGQLTVESPEPALKRFNNAFADLVDALDSKRIATQRGSDLEAGEAQVAIDTAEVEARAQGERYGFRDCGQFLDAGEAPGGAGAGAGAGTGTVAPPSTGGTTPPPTTTPPTTTPPADTPAPPPDDSGGITP
ncbi:MAG: hypothetical protein M3383_06885 [Actinomycetota bacterium]|nr:hypothetical protein [Actinomycetota bacterium]